MLQCVKGRQGKRITLQGLCILHKCFIQQMQILLKVLPHSADVDSRKQEESLMVMNLRADCAGVSLDIK